MSQQSSWELLLTSINNSSATESEKKSIIESIKFYILVLNSQTYLESEKSNNL